eukprot:15472477-Alexandrium_andersonii.AAC.1
MPNNAQDSANTTERGRGNSQARHQPAIARHQPAIARHQPATARTPTSHNATPTSHCANTNQPLREHQPATARTPTSHSATPTSHSANTAERAVASGLAPRGTGNPLEGAGCAGILPPKSLPDRPRSSTRVSRTKKGAGAARGADHHAQALAASTRARHPARSARSRRRKTRFVLLARWPKPEPLEVLHAFVLVLRLGLGPPRVSRSPHGGEERTVSYTHLRAHETSAHP